MRPYPASVNNKRRSFSLVELLIVIGMISVIIGFIAINFVKGERADVRVKTATDLANYLQKARLDSMRRRVADISQMAQVKVFNRKTYSIAIDADGDKQLDIPLVIDLPDQQGIEMNGPFPKTFVFDGTGQTVDSLNHPLTPEPVTLTNSAGASAVRFSQTGDVIVVPAVKPSAAK